jgi:hypothetical protein
MTDTFQEMKNKLALALRLIDQRFYIRSQNEWTNDQFLREYELRPRSG